MMRNKMKKIFTFLILGVTLFTLVSCKDSYKYPNKTPMVTDSDKSFLSVEN